MTPDEDTISGKEEVTVCGRAQIESRLRVASYGSSRHVFDYEELDTPLLGPQSIDDDRPRFSLARCVRGLLPC